jgi:photosystem II stability/assembly factor-like uncharacterized protein
MKKFLMFLSLFIIHYSLFITHCSSQWVYQSLPIYQDVSDIKFFDENTGILTYYTYPSTFGMFRTTNGGFNWTLVNNNIYYYQMQKVDSSTLYLVGVRNGSYRLQKTFNKGISWDSINLPYTYRGISFINRDTGWISGANALSYSAVWRTTNGGFTFEQLTDTTGWGDLFFLKYKVNGEYIGWHYSSSGDDKFWKTTNSGNNWFQITRPPALFLGYFSFIDENTGWITYGGGAIDGLYKTTNGGYNWSIQNLPLGSNIITSISKFKIINYDTLYGTGGYRWLGGGRSNGLIWKTTNGGLNWGYQEPLDTSYHNGLYWAIDFINSNSGWAYGGNGAYTTNGGGSIIYTSINNSIISKPLNYILYQNYPNPFNNMTKIKYQIKTENRKQNSDVKLIIFDILGKEIITLVNGKKSSGIYETLFNGSNLSSGLYFYSLFIENQIIDTKRMIFIK